MAHRLGLAADGTAVGGARARRSGGKPPMEHTMYMYDYEQKDEQLCCILNEVLKKRVTTNRALSTARGWMLLK